MIEQAVAAAGTTDPAAVTAAMAEIRDGGGVMSNFTFAGTDGMPLRDVVVVRITATGGKEFILRATADPAILPKP